MTVPVRPDGKITTPLIDDIPALGNWGTPYLYGPGSIHVAHRDDEHVSMDELREAVAAYEAIAQRSLTA